MFLGIYCSMSASAAGRITEPRAKGIVARLRWDDLDNALLQSRPFRRSCTGVWPAHLSVWTMHRSTH